MSERDEQECERGVHGMTLHVDGFCVECVKYGEAQIARGEYVTLDELIANLRASLSHEGGGVEKKGEE